MHSGKNALLSIVFLIGENLIRSALEKHVFDPKIYVLVERDIRCTIIMVIRIKADLITGFVSIESRTYIRFSKFLKPQVSIVACMQVQPQNKT